MSLLRGEVWKVLKVWKVEKVQSQRGSKLGKFVSSYYECASHGLCPHQPSARYLCISKSAPYMVCVPTNHPHDTISKHHRFKTVATICFNIMVFLLDIFTIKLTPIQQRTANQSRKRLAGTPTEDRLIPKIIAKQSLPFGFSQRLYKLCNLMF